MAIEFKLPEIAESIVEGEISRWLVQEGEFVKRDQPVVEVITDKVTVEIPSPIEGVLEKILATPGQVVRVGETIALFAGAGEAPAEAAPEAAAPPQAPAEAAPAAPAERRRVRAAPAVRRLAREMGIDLSQVPGSGPGGRVTKEDLLRFAEARKAPAPAPAPEVRVPEPPRPTAAGPVERVPYRGVRRTIGQHLTTSYLTAVHTLHVDEADLTELWALRQRAKALAEARGVKLTFLPFFVKAVVQALKAFPMLNASLDLEAGEILYKKYYNIGVAVATEHGLIVPVIRDADRKSLLQVAREIQELSEKARTNRLSLEEVQDGTFTLTNVGSVGGLFSAPILNYPEVGILGIHKIQDRPVVRDGQIVVRKMVYLSLTFDHRVVDGAEAAAFLNRVIEFLEAPELLLLEGT